MQARRRRWACRGTASLCALLGVAAGCTVGPKFKSPEATVTESWQLKGDPRVVTQAVADSQWWKVFKDPTLDRLVELAYQQNLPLQISGLRIMEARAQLGIATGQQFPQVQQVSAAFAAVGFSQNLFPVHLFDRNFQLYQLGIDATWEVDFWGKYRRGVESQAASLLASVGDYYSAIVSLTAEVARTYVLIRTYEVLIEEARRNVTVQEEGLHIAEARFSNGATSELDVTQATTLLQSTRASIPQLHTSLQQTRHALATLLGQPAGTLEPVLAGPKQIPNVPAKVVVGVPLDLLRRRPDIRSAELNAAAQCARIGVAKAELYPSFSLFGSIGFRASSSGGTWRNLFSTDSLFYQAGPQVNWPFLNYGRLKNGVRVEDARFQQLLVTYRDTVLKAIQEVEDAMVGFLDAQESAVFQQASEKAAQRSVELAMVQYREGAVDYQRVLDAERSLLQEQNSLTQTNSSSATAFIALYKALGGGWEVRQGQPIVPEQMLREMKERTNWGDMLSQPSAPETKTAPAAAKQ